MDNVDTLLTWLTMTMQPVIIYIIFPYKKIQLEFQYRNLNVHIGIHFGQKNSFQLKILIGPNWIFFI
jgi:hypothetical protein